MYGKVVIVLFAREPLFLRGGHNVAINDQCRGRVMVKGGYSQNGCHQWRVSYDPGAMTRMLDRLERKGLLRRARCGNDRRKVILELTPEGKAVYPKLIASYVNVLNRFMHGFTKTEAHQLETLLSRMLVNA